MRKSNSKLLPVLRAMDAFTAPAQPAEPEHAAYVSDYCEPETARHDLCTDGGCGCACHAEPQPQPVSAPEPDEYGYWTRRPDGGLHYHAYDPATEDDELNELADHLIDGGDIPDAPVTCHKCGAPVEPDVLAVQTAADGTPKLFHWYCKKHAVAGAERLKAAIREQREGARDGA